MRLLRLIPERGSGGFASCYVDLLPPSRNPPRYAILSHTWGDNEVLFDDVQILNSPQSREISSIPSKYLLGYNTAWREGILHLWIDTCCIDKKNSTELSEAINSMFRYYAESEICYAYLADVPDDDDITHRNSKFRRSRWWDRGWALQELLAPKEVRFYSQTWKPLGTRTELKGLISSITRIPEDVLAGGDCQPPARSLAEILSWASRRETTILEDGAYSLLGLLDINMPLLYGEGERAFLRLQEELLKRYDDESLFAWEAPPNDALAKPYHGLLSPSLRYFEASHRFRHPTTKTRLKEASNPRLLTSQGISLSLALLDVDEPNGLYYALLDCMVHGNHEAHSQPAIKVQHLDGNQYARVDVHHLHSVGFDQAIGSPGQFGGNQSMVFPSQPMPPRQVTGFTIGKELDPRYQSRCLFRVVDHYPPSRRLDIGPNADRLLLSLRQADVSLSTATGSVRVNPIGMITVQDFKGDGSTDIPRASAHICIGLDIREGPYSGAVERVHPWAFLISRQSNMTAAAAFQSLPSHLLLDRPRFLPVSLPGPSPSFINSSSWEHRLNVKVNERQFTTMVLYDILLELKREWISHD